MSLCFEGNFANASVLELPFRSTTDMDYETPGQSWPNLDGHYPNAKTQRPRTERSSKTVKHDRSVTGRPEPDSRPTNN